MDFRRVISQAWKRARQPISLLPAIFFSVETLCFLFTLIVPESEYTLFPEYGIIELPTWYLMLFIPPFNPSSFLEYPELLILISLTILIGPIFLGMYPSMTRAGIKESFAESCKRYPHTFPFLLIEFLLVFGFIMLSVRVSGVFLAPDSILSFFFSAILILVVLLLLFTPLFIYLIPAAIEGENGLSAILKSIKISVKNYPHSIALVAIPGAVICSLLVIMVFLIPQGISAISPSYIINLIVLKSLMVLFVILEAFVISFAMLLFSYGYKSVAMQ